MAGPEIVVAGADPLGIAIVERLLTDGAAVTVLASAAEQARYAHELDRIGARVIVGSPRAPGELQAAGCESAAVLVLAADDDAENVDAALVARRLRPELPLVVRLFDGALGDYLKSTLRDVTILSMSSASAPVFAEMALRALQAPVAAPPPRGRHLRAARSRLRADRVLIAAALAPIGVMLPATIYFAGALGLRYLDALYFVWTTVSTVGYGDIALRDASDVAKIVGMGLMLVGAGFIAVLYALLSGWVIDHRFNVLRGRVPERGRNHVIIAGAGNVGVRVARILAERGYRIVAVEQKAESRNVGELRDAGHHVIIADASLITTLELAGVDRAAAVLAVTDSDATNLHIALAVRAHRPGLPIVIRMVSQELAGHVAERHDALSASSIAIASEAFARAALSAAGAGRR